MAILNFPDNPQTGDQYTGDNGTTYVYDGVKWIGTAGSGTSGTNSIVNNGYTVQVDSTGKLVLPAYALPNATGTTGQVLTWPGSGTTLVWSTQSGSGGSADRIVSGSHSVVNDGSGALVLNDVQYIYPSADGKDIDIYTHSNNSSELWLKDNGPAEIITNGGEYIWMFGKDGTLTLPSSIYPITFTATLDAAHCTTPITLTGDAWTYNIHFTLLPNGTVDINTDQPPPAFLTNPGYNNARTFHFTEADHGIPGYTLDLFIANIGATPPIGFTPLINFTQPPVYPSTLTSDSPIKLSSYNHHWTFGADGSLTFPHGAGFGYGESGQLKVNDGTTLSLDLRDSSGRGFYTNSDGFSLRGNGSNTWKFGTDGKLTFPTSSTFDGHTLTDNVTGTSYTLKIANGSDLGSKFAIGTGSHDFGIANDALNHTEDGYVRYTLTASQVNLTVPGAGNWAFNSNGMLTLPLPAGAVPSIFNTTNVTIGSGTLGETNWIFNADGNLVLPQGSTLGETSSTTVITPPGALMGQSLVIRPTSSFGLTAGGYIVPGQNLTITLTNTNNAPVDNTYINYTITGATAQQLGIGSLTGHFPYLSPSATNPQSASIVLPIPSNSNATTFTLTIDGDQPGGSANVTITVTNNNITNNELSHIHLVTGNPATTDLYLGDDDQYVKIEKNAGNVVVGTDTNTNHWTFNTDGNIVFPDNTVQTTAYRPTTTDSTVWAVQASSQTKVSATQAVAYDSQGNAFALMFQGPWSGGGETRSSIIKLDSHGNTLWAKDLYNNDSVNPWSLCCDPDDNIYAVVERPVGGIYNNTLVKLDGSNGTIIWQVDIQDSQTAHNMQVVYYGNPNLPGVAVAGTAYNGTDNDFFIAFVASDGTTPVGTTTFGDAWDQQAYSIAANSTTGDVLMVGVNKSNTDDYYYLEMVKLGVGGIIWQKKVNVTGNTSYDVAATDCVLLADGNWAILATHNQSGGGGVITMKVSNTDGSILWSRETSQGCTNVSSSMTVGADGHMYVSATTYNNRTNDANIPLVSRMIGAYDTDGNILWQKFLGAPGSNLLLDNNFWNNIGSTGKVLAIHGTHLLIGASLIPMTPYPTTELGVVAQITTAGSDLVLGPFELTSTYLPNPPVTLTSVDSTFATTSGGQTLALSDNVSVTASALTYTVFHSGIQSNQLVAGTKTVTLQSTGTLVDQAGNNVLGEFNGFTENTGNYGNSQISIRNASGYKRINGLGSAPQTWFSVADVATQLGVNQYWITGVSIEFQLTSSITDSGYGYGTMVGTILLARDFNDGRTSVTHTETAITNKLDNTDAFIFSGLDIWNVQNGLTRLRALRTDSNTGQQLDIMWTAKVFINPMLLERYC